MLDTVRQCRHDGPLMESRPCEEQARIALQRADCAWKSGPRRMRELCGCYPDRSGQPAGSSVAVKAPDGGSEFSPGSSSDTEGDLTPSAPPLEEIEELGRTVVGLSGRAMRQVRKLLTVLARMRQDLPPSARSEAVRRLGWHLGPGHEASGASIDDSGPEPGRAPEGGDQIKKYLEVWQKMRGENGERHGAAGDRAARQDDNLAGAKERLAAKRAAELEKRAKAIEQQLPVIAARLSILWNEVMGSSRPIPSEIQLTSTGTEMTAEEHVATAETHEGPPAGCDHRVVGLEQGTAIRDERVGNPGADAFGGDRACHQVAFEDESERRFLDIPQRGVGSDEEAVRHHPRGRSEDRRIV